MILGTVASTILDGVLGGGATGLLGVLLQRYFDAKKEAQQIEMTKIQLAAAKETRAMELASQERMATQQASAAEVQARIDAQAKADANASANLRASYDHDKPGISLVLKSSDEGPWGRLVSNVLAFQAGQVDVIRGLMRPVITAYTLYLLTQLGVWLRQAYVQTGVTLTTGEVKDLAVACVGTVCYLVVTTTVWWFGVRPGQPPATK